MDRNIVFFGCPLDCDEKHDAIQEKNAGAWPPDAENDPYVSVMAILERDGLKRPWTAAESLPVPAWLMPMPSRITPEPVVVDAFIDFMDRGGCRESADRVATFVRDRVLPDVPCLIGVDHSLTGGVLTALAEHYGQDQITTIVLDSHTDAIPMSALSAAIQYDMDTNPGSVYDRDDPFLYNRPDSYNASSFLGHLIDDGILLPKQLFIVGISDYPEKRTARIKDPRIARYVGAYTGLKRRGVRMITKRECQIQPSKLKNLLGQVRTPYVYVSVDMDIGARNALDGVRFRNWQGLKEKQIYRVVDAIAGVYGRGVRLVGMDLTEFNPRRAGSDTGSGQDRTYEIAAALIKKLVEPQ